MEFKHVEKKKGITGIPVSLKGKNMDFLSYGGDTYIETYSDYKFDERGNWTSRTVTTPNYMYKESREYKY